MPHIERAATRLLARAIVGLAMLVPVEASAQRSITLDEAIERSVIRSPQIASQQQQLDNAS